MPEFLSNLDMQQYIPGAIGFATNILLAFVIFVVGSWIAGRVGKFVTGLGARYEKLDSTLFTFLGSLARYVILAFVFIAVLNRFGVETTSICLLYTSPSPRDQRGSRMPSSA